MEKFAIEVIKVINKFCEKKLSVEKRLQSCKFDLICLRASDPFIRNIENFINDLGNLPKNKPF